MGSRLERIEKTVSRCWHKPYLVPRTSYGASLTSEFLPVVCVHSSRNSAVRDPRTPKPIVLRMLALRISGIWFRGGVLEAGEDIHSVL